MVTFYDNSIVITVVTHCPAEDYANLGSELLQLLQAVDGKLVNKPYYTLRLLESLMPDIGQIQKMK